MARSREFGGRHRVILLGAAAACLTATVLLAWRSLGGEVRRRAASNRVFLCSVCGRGFEHTIRMGDTEPLVCAHCGRRAAWIPEVCYWTRDGMAKLEPTYVILETRIEPGSGQQTFCPDCGREVIRRNPRPPEALMAAARTGAGR